jgi:hypothetical protein
MHRQILGRAGAQEDHDWILTTDGSGTDKTRIATGSAWVLRSSALQVEDKDAYMTGWCGSSFGSIQRAEHMALLEGLRAIALLMKLETVADIAAFAGDSSIKSIEQLPPQKRPRVWWVGDRENLILQVARKPDGTTYYARRTEPDLWYGMYWYEKLFSITAVYTPRNTTPDQVDVDARAGQTRALFLPQNVTKE